MRLLKIGRANDAEPSVCREHIKCPVVHSGVQVNSWSADARCEGC